MAQYLAAGDKAVEHSLADQVHTAGAELERVKKLNMDGRVAAATFEVLGRLPDQGQEAAGLRLELGGAAG